MDDCRTARRSAATMVLAVGVTGVLFAGVACSGSADGSPSDVDATATSTGGVADVSIAVPAATDATTTPPSAPTSAVPESTDAEPTNTSPASAPVDPAFAPIGPVVEDYLGRYGMNGAALIVVDRKAGIVHEQYWGEFDASRVSLVASASKMIVAGVVMRLHDDGLLDVDAPVADVVEWGSANPAITPAHLVSNSAGLVGLLPNPAYAPYVCQFRPAGTLQDCARTIFTTAHDDADIVPPDTEFRYGGAQWHVAGAVAEIVSGNSWTELIEEIYVEPCGVESLAFNNHWMQFPGTGTFAYPTGFDSDPSTLVTTDNPNMEGGAYINAPDYAALLLMHLRDGRCDDTQVLSTDALARMHSNRTGDTFGSPIGYGMGWWVDDASGRISDPGAYGATPWLVLDAGYGAYLAVEGDSGPGLASLLYPLVETAMIPE